MSETLASSRTKQAYSADLTDLMVWCAKSGRQAFPICPGDLADYIVALACHPRSLKASTITRRCSAIVRAHRLAGLNSPLRGVAQETLSRIRRTQGPPPKRVADIGVAQVRKMVHALPDTTSGVRDRALLLLACGANFTCPELVALNVEDLKSTDDGLWVKAWRSKPNGSAAGRVVGVPYGDHPESCPVRAVQAWLKLAEIGAGPVFRPVDQHGRIATERLSTRSVARIVRDSAKRVGLEPEQFASHQQQTGGIR